MAKTDLETLIVRMEAQMKAFENELKKGRQVADRETKAIEKRFADANKKIAASFSSLGSGLRQGAGALGVGLGGREIMGLADQYTRIQNALRVTGLEGEKLDQVYSQLYASAQRNAAPLEALTTLYGRAALVQNELKVSSEELMSFTDRVALALRVSGQSAEQSSGALLQLSQALGSGVVRAQEFNSMLEGALPIVQAAANGIKEAGGSVATLRQLVNDGKVSSEAFFRGFLAGSSMLERQARGMALTIGQAMIQFRTAMIDAAGQVNRLTDASGGAVRALRELSDLLKWSADNVGHIEGPYNEITEALHGAGSEAEGLWKWLDRISKLNIPGNIGRYLATKLIEGKYRMLPALPPPSLGDEMQGDNPVPTYGVRNVPLPRPRPAADQISINDPRYKPPKDGTGGSTVGVDSFERAMASAGKRIAVMNAETTAINQGAAARERAKLVAELHAAAVAANAAEGMKNTEVTAEQNVKIQDMADRLYRAADAAEAVNGPLARAARSATDLTTNMQNLAVSSIDQMASSLTDIATGAKTAKEAFADLAQSVIRDLTQMIIKAMLYRAISAAFGMPMSGGGFVGGGGGQLGFAGGGYTGPGGKYQPAGLVHRGEYVFSKDAVDRIGVGNLDLMHRRLRGYAEGGIVGQAPIMPSFLPKDAARSRTGNPNISVVIHNSPTFATDMSPGDRALVQLDIARNNIELERRIINTIREGLKNDNYFLGR